MESMDQLLERVGEISDLSCFPRQQQTSHTDLILNTNNVEEIMDLSDSLFSSLKHPFDFPNHREMGRIFGSLCEGLMFALVKKLCEMGRDTLHHTHPFGIGITTLKSLISSSCFRFKKQCIITGMHFVQYLVCLVEFIKQRL